MISKTAEYAVRACLWLASHPEQAWTAQRIAEEIHAPAGYLAKVLKLLGRAGLVRAQPGPGGGFHLSRDPERLSVLDLIEAVDPLPRIHNPQVNGAPIDRGLVPLNARLGKAMAGVEACLRGCSLADLLHESTEVLAQPA